MPKNFHIFTTMCISERDVCTQTIKSILKLIPTEEKSHIKISASIKTTRSASDKKIWPSHKACSSLHNWSKRPLETTSTQQKLNGTIKTPPNPYENLQTTSSPKPANALPTCKPRMFNRYFTVEMKHIKTGKGIYTALHHTRYLMPLPVGLQGVVIHKATNVNIITKGDAGLTDTRLHTICFKVVRPQASPTLKSKHFGTECSSTNTVETKRLRTTRTAGLLVKHKVL